MNRNFSTDDIQMTNKPMKRGLALLVLKKMQLQTSVSYHFMPTRVAVIKKVDSIKVLVRMWRHWNPYTFLLEIWVKWCKPGNNLAVSQNVWRYLMTQLFSFQGYTQGKWSLTPTQMLHINVHTDIFMYERTETTLMFTKWWIYLKMCVYRMEYYSVIKNKVLTLPTAGWSLKTLC